ncbi:type II toxin-antitoxin system PemK/MazF family toxin [Actinocatenispora rupis]|uniref:mRNA interferase n=1 Tax=Actinocatenispora rupis TaxID=519421 RepID=A0A8J3JEH8_9ACTN|nr:type II toxin-antitoxin system PemK/MazF family toxin [Actinocatenispora rupis]GID14997.1 mRNA interferase [Actinocatenispora rupis]
MSSTSVEPWQVWWAQFDPQLGREQAGRRPAIVVGTELACQLPNNLVILVPCTHTDRGLPWQPQVTLDDGPGYAMCDQVKALDRRRLRKQHACGSLPAAEREAVAEALRELITVDA